MNHSYKPVITKHIMMFKKNPSPRSYIVSVILTIIVFFRSQLRLSSSGDTLRLCLRFLLDLCAHEDQRLDAVTAIDIQKTLSIADVTGSNIACKFNYDTYAKVFSVNIVATGWSSHLLAHVMDCVETPKI
jgi:hypothetical protein